MNEIVQKKPESISSRSILSRRFREVSVSGNENTRKRKWPIKKIPSFSSYQHKFITKNNAPMTRTFSEISLSYPSLSLIIRIS